MLLSLPYWLFQIVRHGKYRTGFAERMGRVPARLMTRERASSPTGRVDLDSRRVGGRGAGRRRPGGGDEADGFPEYRVVVSTTTDTGTGARAQAFRRGERLLFSDGLCICRPALHAGAAAGVGGDCGNRVLAELFATGAHAAERALPWSMRASPTVHGRTIGAFAGLCGSMLANVDLFLAQTEEDAVRGCNRLAPKPDRVAGHGQSEVRCQPS